MRPRLRVLLCTTGDEILGTHQVVGVDENSDSDVVAGSGEGLESARSFNSGSHSSNDEVRTGSETVGLRPGQICDANTPMLHAALHGLGVEVEILRSGDSPDEFREALLARADACDLVITTGGISRGAYEVVRSALGPLGVQFGTVAIQPGGPQGMGLIPKETLRENRDEFSGASTEANTEAMNGFAAERDTDASPKTNSAVPILCFPGNPVSAILSFELFLAPVLRKLSGHPAERPGTNLLLAHDVVSPEHKHQLRRGMIDADGNVVVFGPGSHLIGILRTQMYWCMCPWRPLTRVRALPCILGGSMTDQQLDAQGTDTQNAGPQPQPQPQPHPEQHSATSGGS